MTQQERSPLNGPSTVRRYVVLTTETVAGKYVVEAESEEEAKAKFRSAPPIQWEGVEQIEYSAFDVEIDGAYEGDA